MNLKRYLQIGFVSIFFVCTFSITGTVHAVEYDNPLKHEPYVQLGNAPLTGYDNGYDRVQILWQTVTNAGTANDSFQVDYKSSTSSDWISAGAISTIDTGVSARINHYVNLTNLLYNQDYDYRVLHIRDGSTLATYSATYRTRLEAGDQTPYTFVAYGDSASGNPPTNFISVQDRINAIDPEFAVLLGDNVYSDGTHTEWDLRLDRTKNASAANWIKNHIDYFGWGNHDIVSASGQPALDNYDSPRIVQGVTSPVAPPLDETDEKNYSFDHGDAHFVTIDTNSYTSSTRLAKQLTWAVADLQASSAKWKVVFVHFPIISISFTSTGPTSNYYQQMVAQLKAAGADVIFAGHAHTYERTYPLTGQSGSTALFADSNDNDYAKGAGLPQIVSGLGGRDFHNGNSTPTWLAFARTGNTATVATYGVLKVDVTPNQLTMTQIKASDGSVIDTSYITAGISATNVAPASLAAGATGDVVVSFTTSSAMPSDGKIVVTFPTTLDSGFTLDSGGSTGVSSSTNIDGSLSTSVAGNVVTITRSGGSSSLAGAKTITLSNIKNPALTGSTGAYQIKTTDNSSVTIEEDAAVTADTITGGAMTSTNVQPTSLVAGTTTALTVSLTTTNSLPSNGKIVVTLPTSLAGGFTFDSGGSTAAGNITGIDGSLSISIAGNVATLTRSGGTSFGAGAISFTLSNVANPSSSGSTGVYQIKTTNSSSVTIDQDTSVTSDTITTGPAVSWWNASWDYRTKITFNNSGQSENLTNVPVLVSLDSSRVNYSHILATAADLRFIDSDNGTLLAHEVELWNPSGTSTVWVKVPQIDGASTTDHVYMYYGNDAATDLQDVAGVWSNGYRVVYHFASTTGAYTDSVSGYVSNSSDGHTLTSRTSTLIGYAPTFGGTTANFITIPDSDTFNVATNTIEAIIRPSGAGTVGSSGAQGSIYPVVAKGYGEGDSGAQDIQFYLGVRTAGPTLGSDFEDSTVVTNNAPVSGTTTLSTAGSTNYYVASVVNAGGGGNASLYIDGGLEQTASLPIAGQNALTPNQSGTQKVGIGVAVATTATFNGAFAGIIDEVRISDVARSADWLRFQKMSLYDTANSYGSVQNSLGIEPLTSTSVVPDSLGVSDEGDVVISFTTTTSLPADGKVVITFPTSLGNGFTFSSGGTTAVTAMSGIDGTFTVSTSSNIITLTRVNDGTISTAGSKSITLSNIKNPDASGSTGVYGIKTTNSSDTILDQDSAVTASTLAAGSITSTNVEPPSSLASAVGTTTVTFVPEHAIPADGKIVVTFPTSLAGGFTFSSGGTTRATSDTFGGTLTVSTSSNVLTVTRSGGATTTAGEIESFTLSHIANPPSAGSTGVYQIKVTDRDGNTIDEYTTVPADIITAAPSVWWNDSWQKRIKITFNNSSQAANLVNFPVRVALSSARVTYGDFKAGGDDVRFVDADGTTVLDYEIENWNTASTSNLWVEVPQIDNSSATDYIYMYYSNSGAAAAATTTGVWDDNYITVHHFGQSSGTYLDSTRFDHDSDVVTSVNRTEAVTGSIGFTPEFSGGNSTSYITLPDSNDYDMTSYTIETYINKIGNGTTISTGNGGLPTIYPVITKGMADAENVPADIQFFMGVTSGNLLGIDFENFDIDGVGGVTYSQNVPVSGTSTIGNDTWYHFAERFDAPNDTFRLYKNGFREASTTTTYAPNVGGTQKVSIGTGSKQAGAISAGGGFNGRVDEVRISNIARAEEWIAASAASVVDSYNTYASAETSSGGELTSTNVEPASLVASASGNVVVTFTTETSLPADGKVVITFPTSLGNGFTFSSGGTTAVTAMSGIDGTFTVSTSSNIITLTRVNDGTISTAGSKSITLSNIKNPNLTGSTGVYQIKTTNSSDGALDQDASVSADTITSSTLSATNVEPASLVASASGNVTVSFTTTNIIPSTGKIVITFPTSLGTGYSLGNVAVSSVSGINGSFTVATSSGVVTLTRTGTGNGSSAGGKSIVLTGITNPNIGGATGAYQIQTTNSAGTVIDQDSGVSADNIIGALSSVNIEPASLVAGAVGNVVVTFTTASVIPDDGKIVLTLPTSLGGGFTFDSGSATAVSAVSGIDGSFTVSSNSNTLTLTRTGGTSSTAGSKSITLSNIKNPVVPGSTGTYAVYTKTSADVVLEQSTSITADTISTGSLTSTNVEPASLAASAVGNITVSFTTANPIPVDGRIVLYLPISLGDGFIIDTGGVTNVVSLSGIDGTVTVTDTNNYITITRNGDGTSSSPGVKTMVLSHIKNPDLVGDTGEYTLETRTSASITIDENLNITGDTIVVASAPEEEGEEETVTQSSGSSSGGSGFISKILSFISKPDTSISRSDPSEDGNLSNDVSDGSVFSGNTTVPPAASIEPVVPTTLPVQLLTILKSFPQLKSTFDAVGVLGARDINRLLGLKFILPRIGSLTETGIAQPGVPIKDMTPEMLAKIPSDVVFLRTQDEKLDLGVELSITKTGDVQHTTNLLEGSEVKLFIKVSGKPEKVTGVIELLSQSEIAQSSVPLSALTASAIASNPLVSKATSLVDGKVVLDRFEYTDPDGDGIYEAQVNMPKASGNYKVKTLVDEKDIEDSLELEMITVIDPEGYIYQNFGNQEIRINEAIVTIYVKDSASGEFIPWDAESFFQKNPQVTDKTGRYSFLVPEGTYKINVSAKKYIPYNGEEFQVTSGNPVHSNINLIKDTWWRKLLRLLFK